MYKLTNAEHNISLLVNDMAFDTGGLFQSFRVHYEPFYEAIAYGVTRFNLDRVVFTVWTKQGRIDFLNKWEWSA
jgi:hypothetical protein